MAHGQAVYRDGVSLRGGMLAADLRDGGTARHLAEQDTNCRPQRKTQKGSLVQTRSLEVDDGVLSVCDGIAWLFEAGSTQDQKC